MATIVVGNNPLDPTNTTKYEVTDGISILDWIAATDANVNSSIPHICYVNGFEDHNIRLMSEWDIQLSPTDVVVFIPQMLNGGGGGGSNPLKAILAVAMIAFAPQLAGFIGGVTGATVAAATTARFGAAMLISAFMQPKPVEAIGSGNIKESSPTYSVQAQGNYTSLGSSLQRVYGSHIVFPSWIAAPFVESINNKQVLTQIFSIGHGKYVCDDPKVEDSPISSFTQVDWAYIYYDEVGIPTVQKSNNGIGWSSWLNGWHHRVITSIEVSGQELLGNNESGYGWVGAYVVNKPGTEISTIMLDMVCPRGLYYANNDGSFSSKTVQWEHQARKIDDSGNAVGDWFQLYISQTFSGSSSCEYKIPQPSFNGSDHEYQPISGTIDTGVKSTTNLVYDYSNGEAADLISYYVTNNGGNNIINYTVKPKWNWVGFGESDSLVWFGTVKFKYDYNYTSDVNSPSKTASTNEVQQFTMSCNVPPGRYEVRGRRIDAKDTSTIAGHELRWAGLKAVLTKSPQYQDQTILYTRFMASDKLSQQASRKVNCVVTSILKVYVSGYGYQWQPTRNPYWVIYDILTAGYGGGIDDSYIDVDGLRELAAKADEAADTFDYVMSQRTTVWDALGMVGKSCKTVISRVHGKVYFVRDEAVSFPVAVYTENQILKDSFQIERIMPGERTKSWVEVEFFNRDTWSWDKVQAGVVPANKTELPLQVRVDGITTKVKALDMASYLSKVNTYRRQFVTFQTEMDGFIPTFGDLIAVSHGMPKWGQHTTVASVLSSNTVRVSNNMEWLDGQTHSVAFRNRDGTLSSTYTATRGASDDIIVVSGGTMPSWLQGMVGDYEPTSVVFGVYDKWAKPCLVTSCKPKGINKVTVTAVIDDQRVYDDQPWSPSLPLGDGIYTVPNGVYKLRVSIGNSRGGEPAYGVWYAPIPYSPDFACQVQQVETMPSEYYGGAEDTWINLTNSEWGTGMNLTPAYYYQKQSTGVGTFDVTPGQQIPYHVGKGGAGSVGTISTDCAASGLKPINGSAGFDGYLRIEPIY